MLMTHRSCLLRAVAAALLLNLPVSAQGASTGVYGSAYAAKGKCGAFARAVVTTPAWACLGIVAGPDDGLVYPRNVIEIAPGRLLLTDMGSWGSKSGRLIDIRIGEDGSRILTTLASGLDRPHGLVLGPDGKVYVGEETLIWRFDPKLAAFRRETVASKLPAEGRHPLKTFVFDHKGNLIINFGSSTDRCESDPNNLSSVQYPCPFIEGGKPNGALWLLEFDHPGGVMTSLKPIARGLRNSMALAVEPKSGLIVQGENNIDLRPENSPPEELNVIVPGKSYGWPYCTSEGVLPAYKRFVRSCAGYEAPAVLMPAHGAPLGMLYYQGAMFPQLAGKLIVALHGYRNNGHRIVVYDRDADGRPIAPAGGGLPRFPMQLVEGWDERAGVRPRGAPVAISTGSKGEIWFAEDKNRTVMVLLSGEATANLESTTAQPIALALPPASWTALVKVLAPACGQCHEDFRAGTPLRVWNKLARRGWIDSTHPALSKIVTAMRGQAPLKPMPPPGGISGLAGGTAALESFLSSLAAAK